MLVDASRRTIRHIRISVTDRCQLRCRYCLPEEGVRLLDHGDILRYEEILALVRVAAAEGVTGVRLTGGEPLVRRGIVSFVEELARVEGIRDLSLTTNAILLPPLAQPLRDAGLSRINIGLSSLDPATYRSLTRRGELADALRGLHAAVRVGFEPVKLNAVILRGINDDLVPFLDLTREYPVHVRFIEYMPIGPVPFARHFVPISEIRAKLASRGPFEEAEETVGSGPARRGWRIPGAPGTFSTIAAMSEHICERCNRVRLTSDGHLRPCLFSGHELDLKSALRPVPDPARLRALLREAIAAKPACMHAATGGPSRSMSQIGG